MGIRLRDITDAVQGVFASGNKLLTSTSGHLTRLVSWSDFADWVVNTYESFTQSGSGTGTVQSAISQFGINVKQPPYSATGDGSTDDTAAIQAAIDAVEAAGGGIVFFPKATYKISSALTVQDTDNVKLHGAGATLLAAASFPADYMVKVSRTSPSSTNTLKGFLCRDILFDGDEVAGVLGGISLAHVRAGVLHGLRGVDFPAGGLIAFLSGGAANRTTQNTVIAPDCDNSLYGIRFLGDNASGGFVTRTNVYGGRLRGRGTGVAGGVGIEIGDETKGAGDTGTIEIIGTDTSAFATGTKIFAANCKWGGYTEGDSVALNIVAGSVRTVLTGRISDGTYTNNGTGTRWRGASGYADTYRLSTPSALASGTTNDYALPDESEVIRIPADAAGSTITGLATPQIGRKLTLINRSGGILTLAHQNSGSAEANRIITGPAGGDLVLPPLCTVDLVYDGNQARWWVQSTSNRSAGTVTLTASAASTAVSNVAVTASSRIFLFPTSANAAADVGAAGSVYVSAKTAGTSFTITHPNNANADKTFDYLVVN